MISMLSTPKGAVFRDRRGDGVRRSKGSNGSKVHRAGGVNSKKSAKVKKGAKSKTGLKGLKGKKSVNADSRCGAGCLEKDERKMSPWRCDTFRSVILAFSAKRSLWITDCRGD